MIGNELWLVSLGSLYSVHWGVLKYMFHAETCQLYPDYWSRYNLIYSIILFPLEKYCYGDNNGDNEKRTMVKDNITSSRIRKTI